MLDALEQAQGNNTRAGRKLGWHRRSVERFLRNLDGDKDKTQDEAANESGT